MSIVRIDPEGRRNAEHIVIIRLFLMRLLAMEDGRNVDSPH